MNGEEFLKLLSEKTRCDEKDAARMVASLSDIIVGGLQDGRSVSLQGFGTFDVKKRLERIITNQTIGKRMLYPPMLMIGFRPSEQLKEKVNVTRE